jgi:fructosamine-3-kinase
MDTTGLHMRVGKSLEAAVPCAVRKRLYNFHHVLNHLNLFGDGYLAQAEGIAAYLLGELR